MLEYRDIENKAFPFYFFVNCLREVRNMSNKITALITFKQRDWSFNVQ